MLYLNKLVILAYFSFAWWKSKPFSPYTLKEPRCYYFLQWFEKCFIETDKLISQTSFTVFCLEPHYCPVPSFLSFFCKYNTNSIIKLLKNVFHRKLWLDWQRFRGHINWIFISLENTDEKYLVLKRVPALNVLVPHVRQWCTPNKLAISQTATHHVISSLLPEAFGNPWGLGAPWIQALIAYETPSFIQTTKHNWYSSHIFQFCTEACTKSRCLYQGIILADLCWMRSLKKQKKRLLWQDPRDRKPTGL